MKKLEQKRIKKNKLITSDSHSEILRDSYLLLDTNILIGILSNNSAYNDLLECFNSLNCNLITIDLCTYELFKGSPNSEALKAKQLAMEEMRDTEQIAVLNTRGKDFEDEYIKILQLMKGFSGKKSITDLYMAATLSKFKDSAKNMYVVTEDVKDFETQFFEWVTTFAVLKSDQIKSILFCKLKA